VIELESLDENQTSARLHGQLARAKAEAASQIAELQAQLEEAGQARPADAVPATPAQAANSCVDAKTQTEAEVSGLEAPCSPVGDHGLPADTGRYGSCQYDQDDPEVAAVVALLCSRDCSRAPSRAASVIAPTEAVDAFVAHTVPVPCTCAADARAALVELLAIAGGPWPGVPESDIIVWLPTLCDEIVQLLQSERMRSQALLYALEEKASELRQRDDAPLLLPPPSAVYADACEQADLPQPALEQLSVELADLHAVNEQLLQRVRCLQGRLQEVVPVAEARDAVARAKAATAVKVKVCIFRSTSVHCRDHAGA
jgi:hypothetical protein